MSYTQQEAGTSLAADNLVTEGKEGEGVIIGVIDTGELY